MPVIPFIDVEGRVKVPFWQIAITWLKVGTVGTVMLTIDVDEAPAHPKELVTCNEYVPPVFTLIDCVVAPVDHK